MKPNHAAGRAASRIGATELATRRGRPRARVACPRAETAVFLESAEATLVPRARDADEAAKAARTGRTQVDEKSRMTRKTDELNRRTRPCATVRSGPKRASGHSRPRLAAPEVIVAFMALMTSPPPRRWWRSARPGTRGRR